MLFDLYAIVTDGAKDLVQRRNAGGTQAPRPGCRDAAIYCGLLDERYPDSKPMGFPFDRYPRLVNNRPIPNLDAFVQDVPNSRATQVRIRIRRFDKLDSSYWIQILFSGSCCASGCNDYPEWRCPADNVEY